MIDLSFLSGKRIGVLGLGKTGLSSARALRDSGAEIFVWDDNQSSRDAVASEGLNIANLLEMDITTLDFILWSPGIPHYGEKEHPLAPKAKALGIPLVCDIDILARATNNDILGVTGTNGKSTTTALIAHALSQFRPAQAGGNIGEPVLGLSPMAEDGVYVLELSSYQLELSPNLKPRGAALLNVTPDHLARHGDMTTYIGAKEKIFASVQATERKPVAVIAIDSEPAAVIAERLKGEGNWSVVIVSAKSKADIRIEGGKLYNGEEMIMDFSLYPVFRGSHNHENAACAYALIRHVYGYAPADIVKAMASFEGLPHRQYLVRNINGVSYINDSKATNVEAVANALACMKNIYWILGGQPKTGGLSGLENYMDRIKHAFLIGEASEEFAKFLTVSDIPYTLCETLENAVPAAHKLAQDNRGQPGGAPTVLLSPACASWDQFKSFEHRGDVFTALVQALPEE